MKIKVSIIIPVFNQEKTIERAIRSCTEQNFKDIEIIIINDGSTDGTEQILNEMKFVDERIKIVGQDNHGVNIARKIGIENASGNYITFLDADDEIPFDAIEKLFSKTENGLVDIVAGDIIKLESDKDNLIRKYSEFGDGNGIKFLEFILSKGYHYLFGKLIKKKLFFNNKVIFKEGVVIGEDQILLCQVCMLINKVATVNSVVYNYLVNPQSVTQRNISDNDFSTRHEIYACELFDLVNRFDYNRFIRRQLYFRILNALYLSLHRSGRFSNKNNSKAVYKKTIVKVLLFEQKILILHFPLLVRCLITLIIPGIAYKLKVIF